jgi:hypothetical protein
MPPVPVLSVSDGPRTTVADLVGAPMMIPARILDILNNRFLAETLLRDGGRNMNGLVSYAESTPLFLADDMQEVAEFAEIPVGAGSIGTRLIAYALKKGLAIRISREMRDENRMDDVNRQLTQLTNTAIRAEDRTLRSLIMSSAIPTIAAAAAWTGSTARIRDDIFNAKLAIASAVPAATQADDVFGFEADTIAMHGSVEALLGKNDGFNSVYRNSPLVENDVSYSGKLPQKVIDLDGLKSWSFPKDRVLVLERKTFGFYSDTRQLESTGLSPEGNGPNGGPTESWRSDTTRKRAMGLDQPLAACWITGVQAP